MCGIFGIVGESHPGDEALAAAMASRLRHRGPDEGGLRLSTLGLHGMRRLSIIDIDAGHQPVANETGDVWVTLNGEIYNFKALRADLEARGHRFRSDSDTEAIVHAYEEYGDIFVDRLRGMFAIAVWDERRGRVLLARDRIGKKPLYIRHQGKRLGYASELKALLADPTCDRRIDRRALWHFLTFKHVPAPMCIFEGIVQLPAGHLAVFEHGRLTVREYWRLSFPGDLNLPEGEAAEHILELLDDAVRVRVEASDVPVAGFLSGGLDSSLVVALMARHAEKPLRTFSMGYAERVAHKNDVDYARIVAREFGTEHHELTLTVADVEHALPRVISSFDEPFGGTISPYWLSEDIARHVKVALSGDGADELFGSYAAHRIAPVVAGLRSGSGEYGSFADRPDLARAAADEPDQVWRLRFAGFTDVQKRSLIGPDWPQHEDSSELLAPYYASADRADLVNATLEVECRTFLPDQILTYVDRLSMAHSLEVRVPFLDQYLIEFVGRLPGTLKVRDGVTKSVLRTAASRFLPVEIVQRRKEGFVLPMDTWLKRELRPLAEEAFSPPALSHGLFDAGAVGRFWSEHAGGTVDHTYRIWTLLMFQLWYRAYVEDRAYASMVCLKEEVA